MKISSLTSNFSIENLLSKPRTSPTPPPNASDTAPPIVPMFLPFPAAMPTPETVPAATIFPPPSSMLWPVHGWQFFTPIATASSTKQNAKAMTPPPRTSSTTTGTEPTASNDNNHQQQQQKLTAAAAASEMDSKPGNEQMPTLAPKMPTNPNNAHGDDAHHDDHHYHLEKMPSNNSAFSSLKKACTATVATQFYGSHSAPIHSLTSFNVPSSSSSSSSSSASSFPINSNAIFGTAMCQSNNNDHSSHQIGTTATTVTTAPSTPSSAVFNYGIQQLSAMSSGKRKRRHRTIFTEDQLFLMEEAFINSQYPDVQMREHLADKLKLREERVEVWFKNRRAKERKKTREIQNNQQQLNKSQSMCSSRPSSDGTPKNGHSEEEDESGDDSLDTSPMLVPTKRLKVSAECREQPIEHDKMPHLKQQQQQQQQQQHVPVAHPQKIVPMPPHPQQMSPMAPQQYHQQQQPFFDFAKCFGTFGTAPGLAVTADPMLMHQQHLALAHSLGVAAAAGGAGGAFMQQMPAAMMAEQLLAFHHHSMISRQ
ncbi:hypothetical protein niasHS_011669 [Heterodera schachtii]|uniref:Homeobox domain-containing protein n=1 Tax=Heterodera schachtii TaxID=97005 RepID=A0ABD2IUD0_HETSC